jgi:hypothetical protein
MTARANVTAYGMLIASLCVIVVFIGLILALSGGLTITELNGAFVNFRAVPCTVLADKAVPSDVLVGTSFLGVASVRLDNDTAGSSFGFAAIRQFDTKKRAYFNSEASARASLEVSTGQKTVCGVPDDAQAPTLFSNADKWPIARPAVVHFDRASSQAQLDYKDNLILSGAVFLGVGGGVILLFLATLLMFRCCDKCGDCDCTCCADSYEQYMLERRINSSGGTNKQQQQGGNDADFTEDGLLTHYTCHYGTGACFSLFLARLCGSSSSKSAAEATKE